MGGSHEAGQAPFATASPHVAALGVKLASVAASPPGAGFNNLSVSGVSLRLSPTFTDEVSTETLSLLPGCVMGLTVCEKGFRVGFSIMRIRTWVRIESIDSIGKQQLVRDVKRGKEWVKAKVNVRAFGDVARAVARASARAREPSQVRAVTRTRRVSRPCSHLDSLRAILIHASSSRSLAALSPAILQ